MHLVARASGIITAIVLLGSPLPLDAAGITPTRAAAIAWLERNQNPDGSWGTGASRGVVTAEALLALAKAERGHGRSAQRAIGWLMNQEASSVDHRARAIRALNAAGVDVRREAQALLDLMGPLGIGPASAKGIDSYDTALALGAIKESGVVFTGLQWSELWDRRRGDHGWSGDGIPVDSEAPSDRTVTAEIVRATVVSGVFSTTRLELARRFLSSDPGVGGDAPNPESDSLEIASRLAAIHAMNSTDIPLAAELLKDARLTNGIWSEDAYVNAIGLLALTTKPGATFGGGPTEDDDGDGVANADDEFPQDPDESSDADGDGIGDLADADRDGDGMPNSDDAFPDDPTESQDQDADGLGDNRDPDDDGDGIEDELELELGTNPANPDSDGDGLSDSIDTCPALAFGADQDSDGVCAPQDQCDHDPSGTFDLDGDGACDESDLDVDGDGYLDREELAFGSDPRNPASTPTDLATADPNGDFDRDGIANGLESVIGSSAFLADSDSDGSLDWQELALGTSASPLDSSDQLPAILAVFSSSSTAPWPETTGSPHATATAGQATPIANSSSSAFPQGSPFVNLVGFQPQTLLGRDIDGDGVTSLDESAQGTSWIRVDTDGDGFVDGPDGFVRVQDYPSGWNLNAAEGDAYVDGEHDFGTDPADASRHPGELGDVAPLGRPNGEINTADALVQLRIVTGDASPDGLPAQNAALTWMAADVNADGVVDLRDAQQIFGWVMP